MRTPRAQEFFLLLPATDTSSSGIGPDLAEGRHTEKTVVPNLGQAQRQAFRGNQAGDWKCQVECFFPSTPVERGFPVGFFCSCKPWRNQGRSAKQLLVGGRRRVPPELIVRITAVRRTCFLIWLDKAAQFRRHSALLALLPRETAP